MTRAALAIAFSLLAVVTVGFETRPPTTSTLLHGESCAFKPPPPPFPTPNSESTSI